MRIPLYNPRAEYLALKDSIDRALNTVLESGVYSPGPNVEAFEKELAEFLNVEFAAGVGSGTAALELTLRACQIGAEDEVVTVPNSDISTTAAISHCGARVVFCDIDNKSLVIDPEELEKTITPRTKAILPVHLFGQPADMSVIKEIAALHHLFVIEDAALAVGARYKEKLVGSLGDAGCLSLNSRKILSAFGDGGVVITNRKDIFDKVRSLRNYGKNNTSINQKFLGESEFLYEGFNERLDEIQAAVLRVKLKTLPKMLQKRASIANRYNNAFRSLPIAIPIPTINTHHAYRAYTILVDQDRDALIQHLSKSNIDVATYYTPPLHLQPAYKYLGHQPGDFPITEKVSQTMLSIPVHPMMTETEVSYVIRAITDFFHGTTSD